MRGFQDGPGKWQEASVGPGSICYADGCLYVHGEENNKMALVEATAEAYRQKGEFTPPDSPSHSGRGPKAWAYPVIANGRLYVRDQNFSGAWTSAAKGRRSSRESPSRML